MIAPALRLVAAVAGGARLVARPRSAVMHVYSGPLTPSGRFAAAAGRTVCRARTRRLTVIESASLVLDSGKRRVCARCEAALPVALGRVDTRDLGPTLDERKYAFANVTTGQFQWAGRRAATVDESHQIGGVATLVHGPKPATPPARRTPNEERLAAMHDAIHARRRALANASRTPEEIEATHRARENETRDVARINQARRDALAVDRAISRRTRSQWLTPHERELLNSA